MPNRISLEHEAATVRRAVFRSERHAKTILQLAGILHSGSVRHQSIFLACSNQWELHRSDSFCIVCSTLQ